jgi:protein-disulfide isomerase
MMSRTRALGLVAIAAVAIVGALVVASQLGSASSSSTSGGLHAGSRTVQRELRGIPQRGNSLGSQRAPATLLEFADLQCPFCAQYTRDALPGLLHRYVRSGRLRMELELLSFIGPDSKRAARFAAAAALQDRLWSFSDLFYRQQGVENSGYVTGPFLRSLAHATLGLDGRRAFVEQSSPRVRELLARARQEAGRLGVTSTPSFFLLRPGRQPRRLEVSALTTEALSQAIDSALGPPQA